MTTMREDMKDRRDGNEGFHVLRVAGMLGAAILAGCLQPPQQASQSSNAPAQSGCIGKRLDDCAVFGRKWDQRAEGDDASLTANA
jgi:hypothetical protein